MGSGTVERRLIDVQQLATILGISVRSAYRLAEDGVPHLRVRGQIRFDLQEVLDALRKGETKP